MGGRHFGTMSQSSRSRTYFSSGFVLKRRLVYFFPQNPWPPRSGAHRRCMEMLAGLREIGFEITVYSATHTSERPWEPGAVRALRAIGVKSVQVHRTLAWEGDYVELVRRLHDRLRRPPGLTSSIHSPPGMRWEFSRLLRRLEPEVVIINYAQWDGLRRWGARGRALWIIENHDLVTMNGKMRRALDSRLVEPVLRGEPVPTDLLREDVFSHSEFEADLEEYEVYDRYDRTFAISETEARKIRAHTEATAVVTIPMCMDPAEIANTYDGPAVYAIGPNPFNLQGYFYFVRRVLDLIRRRCPGFRLAAFGTCYRGAPLPRDEGVRWDGFVEDVAQEYRTARFAISPVLGGTGQQVKIVEAMAYGLPVVALRGRTEPGVIDHGVNGFVAEGAEDFAECVSMLWNDPRLCRRMGEFARRKISERFSRRNLATVLAAALQPSEGAVR